MFKNMKFSHKILLMPGLAAVAFLIIFFLTQSSGAKNEKLLNRIEAGNFPAFELSRDLVELLASLQRGLSESVSTSDEEMLAETDSLRDSFLTQLEYSKNNVTLEAEELENLEKAFQNYYALARKTTERYINDDMGDDFTAALLEMQSQYNQIKETLLGFKVRAKTDMEEALLTTKMNQKTSMRITIMVTLISLVLLIGLSIILIRSLTKRLQQAIRVADQLSRGDQTCQIEINSSDEIGQLLLAMQKTVDYLQQMAGIADSIAKGRVDVDIIVASEADALGQSMLKMKNTLQHKAAAANQIAQGNLDTKVDVVSAEDVLGNAMVTMVSNLKKSKEEVETATTATEANLQTAQAVVDEVNRVAEHLKEGKLSERANAGEVDGEFKRLIDGFNTAIDNILEPVNEAVAVLKKLADGDLTVKVSGNYKGDHAAMKDALNFTLKSLNDILGNVTIAVEQVASGSEQISNSSQSLSEGATEQASSLEEVTSSMNEIGSQTSLNADNAAQANQLGSSAREGAGQGNKQMKQMLKAMDEINKSSQEISKIIKSIDEIAFQTNLLALNAAVEAARAGVHGKGFAVVAEEVRNLAQRSAQAAQKTTELIEGSVQKVKNGTEIAHQTAKALGDIVDGVTIVTDLVGEIASASTEQAQGIEQINTSLDQIGAVTQSNTANAEESASAAQELTSQAAHLKEMLSRFKLNNSYQGGDVSVNKSSKVNVVNEATSWGTSDNKGANDPKEVIALDDKEFGKF